VRFARYQLLQQINAGGRGELWLAEQLGPNGFSRKVVVARLASAASSNPTAVEAFIKATRSGAAVDHAHVARVFDIGCEDGQFFYARTWVDGMSARQLLAELAARGESVPLEHALLIARRVADAVAAAHESDAGVVHGALSSSRVLISRHGEVVVTGFTGEVIFDDFGGPAPERHVDKRSDVYAIGALLYELIAGVTARAGGERPALASIAPEIPDSLDAAIARALQEDPDERHPDVESFLFDLRGVASGLPGATTFGLGTWLTEVLDDDHVTLKRPRRDARKIPVIEPTLVRPASEMPRPRRTPRGSISPPAEAEPTAPPAPAPDPLRYAKIPVMTRPRRNAPRERRSDTARQLLIVLAIALLLFAASTTITMALQ
jgi:serine/threonine-protein kinase